MRSGVIARLAVCTVVLRRECRENSEASCNLHLGLPHPVPHMPRRFAIRSDGLSDSPLLCDGCPPPNGVRRPTLGRGSGGSTAMLGSTAPPDNSTMGRSYRRTPLAVFAGSTSPRSCVVGFVVLCHRIQELPASCVGTYGKRCAVATGEKAGSEVALVSGKT